jgi:hypothetical protein
MQLNEKYFFYFFLLFVQWLCAGEGMPLGVEVRCVERSTREAPVASFHPSPWRMRWLSLGRCRCIQHSPLHTPELVSVLFGKEGSTQGHIYMYRLSIELIIF